MEQLSETRVPIDMAVPIGQAMVDILAASDLDGDGAIQGTDEWLAFVLGVYEAVQDFTDTNG